MQRHDKHKFYVLIPQVMIFWAKIQQKLLVSNFTNIKLTNLLCLNSSKENATTTMTPVHFTRHHSEKHVQYRVFISTSDAQGLHMRGTTLT